MRFYSSLSIQTIETWLKRILFWGIRGIFEAADIRTWMCDACVISNTILYSWESKIWSIVWSSCCIRALSWNSNWIAAKCWILKGGWKTLYVSLAFFYTMRFHPSILIYEMPSYFGLPNFDQICFRCNVFIILCFIRGEGVGTEFPWILIVVISLNMQPRQRTLGM